MSDQPDVRPEDALSVAQNNASRVTDLEETVENLVDRLDDQERKLTQAMLRLSERDEKDYADLTVGEKVERLRAHAYRRAKAGAGRTTLDYQDVMWEVFDGKPGAKHCYKLMRLAADYDDGTRESQFPGIEWQTPNRSNYRIVANADVLEAHRQEFFPENKATHGEGGRA